MIEVLSSGALNLVQDRGRWGHLSIGVSRSGAMDQPAYAIGNALVGNRENEAAVEVSLFPFRLKFNQATTFACTGADCGAELDGLRIPPWWARSAQAGQTLVIGAPRRGARAYFAVRGGIEVPMILGSRSTDLKGGFGGFQGRGLRRGDRLDIGQTGEAVTMKSGIGAVPAELPGFLMEAGKRSISIRVLPGAEYECFNAAARQALETTEYLVTPDANRMGYRLSGTSLALASPLELMSHGIVPGTIQVPPSGQPIVQLAEANTCGGYPKIANVIEADLWRLAQAPIGCRLSFKVVSADVAGAALRDQFNERALICRNLVYMRARA